MILYNFKGEEININGSQLTVKQNNDELIDDFLSVASSYLNRDDIEYKDGLTVIWMDTATNGMDCSTFVSLCLMGWNYYESPYYTHRYINRDSWVGNPSHNWSLSTIQYKISRFIDGHNPDERIRLACQLARWMRDRGCYVPMGNGLQDVRKGDIVFWGIKRRATNEWYNPTWYEHISHIGIVYDIEDAPNTYDYTDSQGNRHTGTWDKSRFPFKHTIIECTNVTPCVTTYRYLERGYDDPTNVYESNYNTLVMICRPDLGALRFINE